MNSCCLIGNIVNEIELKQTTNGKYVLENTIAVRRDDEKADFINFQVWGSLAENMSKYCKKGDRIAINGEIHVDRYVKDEQTKYKSYVYGKSIEYLFSKKNEKKEENIENNKSVETFKLQDLKVDDDSLPFY